MADKLETRKTQREEKLAEIEQREEAARRLEGAEERIPELAVEDLDQVEQDLEAAWAGWTPREGELRQLVKARRSALAAVAEQRD